MKWVKVNPDDYDLSDIVDSLERIVSVELETGLRVQVLRAIPIPGKDKWAIRRAIKDESGTWADVAVTDKASSCTLR